MHIFPEHFGNAQEGMPGHFEVEAKSVKENRFHTTDLENSAEK